MTLFLTIAAVHIAALITPGPDFFFVSQTAVSRSRAEAMRGVLGITAGIMVWVSVALLGLHILLAKFPWLHQMILFCGGSYLSWMGVKILHSVFVHHGHAVIPASLIAKSVPRHQNTFVRGLFTNLSNPKALIFFGSIFSGFIIDDISSNGRWIIFTMITITTFLWFAIVAFIFSLPTMTRGYQRAARWIDSTAGTLFIAFGMNLLLGAFGVTNI